jgi:hypothetical protein
MAPRDSKTVRDGLDPRARRYLVVVLVVLMAVVLFGAVVDTHHGGIGGSSCPASMVRVGSNCMVPNAVGPNVGP